MGRGRGQQSQQGYGGFDVRWQNSTDDRLAELEDRMYETALILRGIQTWQQGHDKYHSEERENRGRTPDDIRGWITLGVAILSILIALGIINPR